MHGSACRRQSPSRCSSATGRRGEGAAWRPGQGRRTLSAASVQPRGGSRVVPSISAAAASAGSATSTNGHRQPQTEPARGARARVGANAPSGSQVRIGMGAPGAVLLTLILMSAHGPVARHPPQQHHAGRAGGRTAPGQPGRGRGRWRAPTCVVARQGGPARREAALQQ